MFKKTKQIASTITKIATLTPILFFAYCTSVFASPSFSLAKYTLHAMVIQCERGSKKGQSEYSNFLWGFSDKNHFSAFRDWKDNLNGIGFQRFEGQKYNNNLIIKGTAGWISNSKRWKLSFEKKTDLSINDALKEGINGKDGSRECVLKAVNSQRILEYKLYNNLKNTLSFLKKEKRELEKKLENSVADPLLAMQNQIEAAGRNKDEIQQGINKLIQEREKAEKELIKQLEFEKAEIAEANIRKQKLLSEIAQIEADKILSLQSTSKAKLEADELLKSLQSQIESERAVFDAQMEAERLAIAEAEQQTLILAEKRQNQTEVLKATLEEARLERQKAEEAAKILASFADKEEKEFTFELAKERDAKSTALTQVASSTQPATVATSSSVSMINTATPQTVRVSASASKWQNASSPEEAQRFADEIQASIVMFMAIAEVIEKQPLTMKDRVLSVVDSEIVRLQQEKQLLQDQLSSRFSTPIRPNNANLSVSAFRAADTFPKIPFYVPGTNEIGEMLVVPRVSDEGYLNYQFDFLDPTSTYDKVRDRIDVAHDDIGALIFGLQKVDEWTLVAQENGVTRRVEKTSACIPDGMCEEKKQGVSSTEVVFQIYEDGSTAGRIQRNKGQFSTGYNMSVESSILLSAYLTYMRDVGAKEFNIGVMTDDEVKDLFN